MVEIRRFNPLIAYFSMEFGLHEDMPIFAGGLGVLAGDMIKTASDMAVPMVGVGILYNQGYCRQKLENNWQTEHYPVFDPSKGTANVKPMLDLEERVKIRVQNRDVNVRAWLHEVEGINGFKNPLLLLDTNGVDNREWDVAPTSKLYGGSGHKYDRIVQEKVLGVAGVRMVHKLGFRPEVWHLNEGHGAFAFLELANIYLKEIPFIDYPQAQEAARQKMAFTTHTPVAAGHDRFPYEGDSGVSNVFYYQDHYFPPNIRELAGKNEFDMTLLAYNGSRYRNAVAKRHQEVTKERFGFDLDYITNGVHAFTWASPEFQKLYNSKIPSWKSDPSNLVQASGLDGKDVIEAHDAGKKRLVDLINQSRYRNADFNMDDILIGFARRFATYKRADLIFSDIDRLASVGPLQLVFAGKAHPMDAYGKEVLRRILQYVNNDTLKGKVKVAFLEDYDMAIGKRLVQGSDVWLNTPRRPEEASGTSGMKAAFNGIPNLSVHDGWWAEAEGGGWTVGKKASADDFTNHDYNAIDKADANSLYMLLANEVLPRYRNKERWAEMMKESISKNASYFNTHRMLKEYLMNAYFPSYVCKAVAN